MTEHEKEIREFGNKDDFWLFGYGSLIWKPPPHYDKRIPGYIEGYVRRFWQTSEDHRGTPEAPGRVATLIDRSHWETLTDHHAPTERVWGAAYHIPASRVPEVRAYLDIREINGYSIQFTPFHPAPFTATISSPPSSPSFLDLQHRIPSHNTSALGNGAQDRASADGASKPTRHKQTLSISMSTTISATTEPSGLPIRCLVYIGLPENPQFLGPQDPDVLARRILSSRGPSGENKEYLYMLERSLLELSKDSGDSHVSDLVRRAREIENEELEREGYDRVLEEEGLVGVVERKMEVGVPLHRVGSTEEQEEVEHS
ncbi:ChaC-domain-containing protein [Lojkania enalia]|uniref:glutathione-specific gamma-glutamylcyclotransferase n=1 Tax=Lojkania enalia TaxID=147567 RepID=A0A9P4NCL3_9PLEO|nr:ChaC-domain-containing protein [Didymosphaeria enalia]